MVKVGLFEHICGNLGLVMEPDYLAATYRTPCSNFVSAMAFSLLTVQGDHGADLGMPCGDVVTVGRDDFG